MAVNLLGDSDARIDFGDLAGDAGATGITISITIATSNISDNERLASHWLDGTDRAWLVAIADADEIVFVVSDGSSGLLARVTSGLNLISPGLYRIVCRWRASAKAMEIWVNGVSQTVGVYLGLDGTPASLGNATSAIQVGHETAESIDGIDADYSEFAIHTSYMPDQYCVAYGLGYSPRFFGQTGFLYCPMWSATQLLNLWGSAVGTNSNGANAAHPPVIKPIGLHSAIFVPAVGQISLISSQVALVTSRRVIAY